MKELVRDLYHVLLGDRRAAQLSVQVALSLR